MKDAQKPDHISLSTLVLRLKEGRYVIPDFQREFEWNPSQVKDLMKSIFLDYYIGSLLLWKGETNNFEALSCEVIYGYRGGSTNHSPWNESGNAEYIVLDGQQRLTALYYALVAPNVSYPGRKRQAVYFINAKHYVNEEYDKAFDQQYMWEPVKNLIANPDKQYETHQFPLSIIGDEYLFALSDWMQGYERYWQDKTQTTEEIKDQNYIERSTRNVEIARHFASQIKDIVDQYQISYIELDRNIGIDKVCDIFTNINSTGTQLSVFDLINALLKPKGLQLKSMWRAAKSRLAFVESSSMNVYVLQVMSILAQAYSSPKYLYYLLPGQEKQVRSQSKENNTEILVESVSDFEKKWHDSVTFIERAIQLLSHPQEYGVMSSKYLPYTSMIPIFAALLAESANLVTDSQLQAKRKIRLWYWSSVFTLRYAGAVSSTSAYDYISVKRWINDNESVPLVVQDFKNTVANLDLRNVTRTNAIYLGVFNLLVLQGARDWISGDIPIHSDLDDHHIIPVSWAKTHMPDSGQLINTILNRTALTSLTNRHVIGKHLPNQYIPELMEQNGAEHVEKIMESHFISQKAMNILAHDPFTQDHFADFITERRNTIIDAIQTLLIKERLDLSLPLRELDIKIENTELNLRAFISEILNNDTEQLPVHVSLKLKTAISTTAQVNPLMNADDYTDIMSWLEFADLRDLQSIITSKIPWSSFENTFTSKEALNTKFTQLAELRNAIRHSRDVTIIVKKEGEASIIWFDEILPTRQTP